MKSLLLLSAFTLSAFAQDIVYTKDNTHAFLPKNGTVNLILSAEAINDTLDVFKVKESEVSTSSANYDSLGDMTGINLELSYAFLDNFYLHTNYNRKDIGYLDSNLINNKFDISLRYQVFANENHAFAIDGGMDINIADDTTITDANTTTNFANKAGISVDSSAPLSMKDSQDFGLYTQAIYTYKADDFLFDLFAGYKQITIDASKYEYTTGTGNSAVTTIASRDDGMLFAGLGLREKFGSFYTEVSYKYTKMLRIEGLKENLTNHIFDLNVTYPISDKVGIFLGGKIMTNQFNGEIPYLYNQYTQSSFDKKYGYASTGLIVKF
ncbi:hypothetical protein [Poseidonibacter sp.]|uniref:hypothetical protein n=1 Tax=Poseidonibacter sp. TaxID=2321188 RepID=UPI003C762E72